MKIGEVTPAAARNCDLLTDAIGMFDDKDPASPLAGFNGAEKPSRSAANDDRIPMRFQVHSLPLGTPSNNFTLNTSIRDQPHDCHHCVDNTRQPWTNERERNCDEVKHKGDFTLKVGAECVG